MSRNEFEDKESQLQNIYYGGTEDQWNAVTKGSDWDLEAGYLTPSGTYAGVYDYNAE